MDSKTCQTCKHWTEDPEFVEGICSQLTVGFPIGKGVPESNLLRVRDGFSQQEYGTCGTPPDFGCTLHEARSEA